MNKAIKIKNIRKFTNKGQMIIFDKLEKKKFNLKRFFTIRANKNLTKRGGHGHKICDQIMIITEGSAKITVFKKKIKYFKLKKNESIFVPKNHWVDIQFINKKSSLLVLCNYKFDLKEYIFDKKDII
ncbi:WxcM-like domain-containing protein [Pelagibacteraceae bacterium]|nr:WxcM-like domain-containing protein [Pelagibacteraceae bacterium]